MVDDARPAASWGRRAFLGAAGVTSGALTYEAYRRLRDAQGEPVFIGKVDNYDDRLHRVISDGIKAVGIVPRDVAGKNVVLKPNLVEPDSTTDHVNTHPIFIKAAVDTFRSWGAAKVTVAEGAGHVRDPYYVLEASGLLLPLADSRTPFVDLNFAPTVKVANRGRWTGLGRLVLPREVVEADLFVSMAKLKTHHWAGVTLAMKNLFGVMPGTHYGWPKNVLHDRGLVGSILDINSTVRTHLAMIDGVVGMGGDGPIMGPAVRAGVVVIGRNPAAVDATGVRVMGLSPAAVGYLRRAPDSIGPIDESVIEQRGELITAARTQFPLFEKSAAQRALRG